MLIQNYDKISKRNIKFDKIYTFKKNHIYWTMINTPKKKTIYSDKYTYIFNNKLQKKII
jgi:hypothetical protein